jgi:hypothetical protein
VFGEKFNCASVGDGVRFRQVFHGFDQQTLAVDVAGIGGSLASPSSYPGDNWNSEDLGHEKSRWWICLLRWSELPA